MAWPSPPTATMSMFQTRHLIRSGSLITSVNAIFTLILVGDRPTRMAASPDGACIYVTKWADNQVTVIETATNTVVDTISVGGGNSPPWHRCHSRRALCIYRQPTIGYRFHCGNGRQQR